MASPTGPTPSGGGSAMVWPLGNNPADGCSGLAASAAAVVGVADLRTANAAAVLAAVRAVTRPPRLANLVETTRLSRPTVEVIVEDLLRCGLIEDAPATSSRGVRSPGRPARRFRFRPRAGFVVGVDIRAYSVGVCLADLDGEPVAVRHRTVRRDLTGQARAKAMITVVRDAMEQVGVTPSQICAATVGTPGWVEDNTRVRYVDNLKDWAEVDIAATLSELLGCPVAVDNDANLAALGEQWRGVGATTSEMIFILLGERLGAGIITGGRPLRGHHGAAGEIGFMVFPDGNPLAARAIGVPGAQRPGIDPSSIYSDADVVHGAADGDPGAISALESVGRRLAEAMAPVLLTLDPALVVLGTSLFARPHLAIAFDHVLKAAERHSPRLLVDPPEWRMSALGDDAILTGAVRFALSAVERILLTRPTTLFGP
ncbi:ROK family protein [Streptosporangium sp. CA-115845]|uniref:ROK family protein n=1 Tax=Streptosporangium sp. CA-115845 TaxID=3240071 RepID=UPI003D94D4D9